MNLHRLAILDDYQNVALTMADWSPLTGEVEITVFNTPLGPDIATALKGYDMVCLMRERTAFPGTLMDALPDLRLIVTTGMRNAAIDLAAAKQRGIVVCGTVGAGNPTSGIAIGLMLELTRHIGLENARMKAGAVWQTTLGADVEGKTMGLVGVGRVGLRTAKVAQALGMKVVGWSQNFTPEKAEAAGVGFASKDELFRQADVISIHYVLSPRSRGLVGAHELGLMKPTAFLINTARGPIVDEAALIEILRARKIAGAGLDVFDTEPLPIDHPYRSLDNVVLTPHLGYVTTENYRVYYAGAVEDVRAYLNGKPKRVIED